MAEKIKLTSLTKTSGCAAIMCTLNKYAKECMKGLDVHAYTDITGCFIRVTNFWRSFDFTF